VNRPLFARILARVSATAERKGGAAHRDRLLHGLRGRVIEVGAGTGVNFVHYPAEVAEVVAVEPEPNLRARASRAARSAPVPVVVVDGVAEGLPVEDGSMDAGVAAGLLCSVPDPQRALAELVRVIRPGGELRFYEHVGADTPGLARLQRLMDATVWPRVFGGCRTSRDTERAIAGAGFALERCERFSFRPSLHSWPIAPRILGSARRPASGNEDDTPVAADPRP
jgi:ubiquinone/menaquinone biosynthesis C-methylase UbiE